jgi:hypothetical protein
MRKYSSKIMTAAYFLIPYSLFLIPYSLSPIFLKHFLYAAAYSTFSHQPYPRLHQKV